ncbi:nuclear transport factor 2 family protein [Nocardia carnea]|uniref:nuclear transport factor 2 family protein n=1 Tax=Nocardia carnea TaxID=37328 RepID=UPI002453B624|nr:nuclear transport factor 2 family protein [Nocardia carnea]
MSAALTPNEQVIRGFFDSYNAFDANEMRKYLADDIQWIHQGAIELSGTYSGIEAVIEDFIKPGWDLYESGTLKLELVRTIDDGTSIAVEFVAAGIAKATGRKYHSPYAFFIDIADAKIKLLREYVDTTHAQKVLFG